MMCRFLLKHRERQNWLQRTTEPFFSGMVKAYQWTLSKFLRVRWVAWPLMLTWPRCETAS
ncbi:hypothetical protein D3C83_229620 [compost metagenome]